VRALCVAYMVSVESTFSEAVHHGDISAIRAALEDGADVNEVLDEPDGRSKGVTALMLVLLSGDSSTGAEHRDELVALLLRTGAEVDAEAEDGMSALRIAVERNLPSAALLLLHAGADADGSSGNLLTIAAQIGHAAVAGTLIEAGADVNAYSGPPIDATPLLMAAAKGHTEVVSLLLDAGARTDLENSRGVAPHTAAIIEALRGQGRATREVVQMLLSAGAPASSTEEMVLRSKPQHTAASEAVGLLREWRERERAASSHPLVQWFAARIWYFPIVALLLWLRGRLRKRYHID